MRPFSSSLPPLSFVLGRFVADRRCCWLGAEHREKIRTLEREWEIERDRRDKEERRAIAKAEQDMLKIQDQHISEVTRKAIEDNAQLELEIAYQSRQVKQLYEENGDYTRTTIQLRRELEVQQDAERVLAQKNCSYQKTIKALLAKMKKLEQENAVYKGEIDAFSAAGNPPPQRDMRMTSSTEGGFELDAETATLADAQAKLVRCCPPSAAALPDCLGSLALNLLHPLGLLLLVLLALVLLHRLLHAVSPVADPWLLCALRRGR